jgi:hypothetical protein
MTAIRLHPSLGCFTCGAFALALVRTSETLKHRRAGALPVTVPVVVVAFLRSLAVAVVILIASLVPSFFLFPAYPINHARIPMFVWGDVMLILLSALLSVPIVAFLRRNIW